MIRKTICIVPLVASILALAGCKIATFWSEEEQWEFTDPGLVIGGSAGIGNDTAILEGSIICPDPDCRGECPEDADSTSLLLDCFEHTADGPGTVVQDDTSLCLQTDGPGELTWYMDPILCDANDEGYLPIADWVSFDIVAVDVARVLVYQWADDYAAGVLDPASGEEFPDDLFHPEGDPYQVLADVEVIFLVVLWDSTTNGWVAWNGADGNASLRAVHGSFEITELVEKGWLSLTLENGAEAILELTVGDRTWDAATLVGVGEDTLASVELVTAFNTQGDDEETGIALSYPEGARAIFRDTEERPVYGVPVEWTVSNGTLSVYPGPFNEYLGGYMLPGADYAILSDNCLPPSKSYGERTALLRVSYGDLSDSMKLTWTLNTEPGEDPEEEWEKPEQCMGRDCSCDSSGGPTTATIAWLPILVLAVLRRRYRDVPGR